VYVGIFDRLTLLQVTRNMVLLLLFTHTVTSRIVGISPTGMHLSTDTAGHYGVNVYFGLKLLTPMFFVTCE
jgi:hypothetical protein